MTRTRAREFGISVAGHPGPNNAITDVPGVQVGHVTVVEGDAVRTGITAVRPRTGDASPVFAGQFVLNGNGEMTGSAWIAESGFLDGPVLLTNTHSVGTVRDGYIRWLVETGQTPATNAGVSGGFWALPVVAETFDGVLNDINGFHLTYDHVKQCLESCEAGPVAEGAIGAGTGTIAFGFKAGIGTASRIVDSAEYQFRLGVLVQSNCGLMQQLVMNGAPIGIELARALADSAESAVERGSIIIVIATDAPLLPHQINRLAKRAAMGLARTGSSAGNGSGDLIVAFSTAPVSVAGAAASHGISSVDMLRNELMSPLFEAVVQATEEAILNSLFAADSMTGRDGSHAAAMPLDSVRAILRQYRALDC